MPQVYEQRSHIAVTDATQAAPGYQAGPLQAVPGPHHSGWEPGRNQPGQTEVFIFDPLFKFPLAALYIESYCVAPSGLHRVVLLPGLLLTVRA